jgi:hypothetical protein
MPSSPTLRDLIEEYTEDARSLGRAYGPSLSPVRTDRLERFQDAWEARVRGTVAAPADREEQLDRVLLLLHITHQRHLLARSRTMHAAVAEALPFLDDLLDLLDARRRRETPDPRAVADALTDWTKALQTLRDTGPLRPPLDAARTAQAYEVVEQMRGVREALTAWFRFYNGYDPLFTWWAAEPYRTFDAALAAFLDGLSQEMTGGLSGQDAPLLGMPIGPEAVRQDLADAVIAYDPDDLIAIAETEMDWCRRRMLEASRALGFGDDWRAALEHVKDLHVPPGEQPALIYRLAEEGVRFAEEHDQVTIPALAQETWRSQMMPPERQDINPFFTGGEVISISYPTMDMPHAKRLMSMRGNATYLSRSTVFHELLPGHYLQQFMNARHRPYRRLFRNPYWLEGNAFYWEMVYWDLGFPDTPEARIGMLFWRMHRAARVMYTLKFHLGRMSLEEAAAFLVDAVGHERDTARGEVRRLVVGGYDPLYQCAYMIGALQFRGLHRELVATGKMTARTLHDTILRENQMPVEMLRRLLTGASLAEPEPASWRFYQPPAD